MNKRIDDLIYLTGAKFGSKKGKDALTGREFDLTVGQRLSPSTKKPIGAKRMKRPEDAWMQSGGKQGEHSEYLGYVLAVMQHLPRMYPEATW